MTEKHESRPLDEADERDRARIEQVEQVVIRVLESDRPATMSELSLRVRSELGQVENSVIRAAVLRLLNSNRLRTEVRREVHAA